MRERAFMESVVIAAGERAGGARVKSVRLEIGRLSGMLPEAVGHCFQACTRGTSLEGARLEIAEIPGRGRCGSCARELAMDRLSTSCPCGVAGLRVIAGRELRLAHLELACGGVPE